MISNTAVTYVLYLVHYPFLHEEEQMSLDRRPIFHDINRPTLLDIFHDINLDH